MDALHLHTFTALLDCALEYLAIAADSPAGEAIADRIGDRCATPLLVGPMRGILAAATAQEETLASLFSSLEYTVLPMLDRLSDALEADATIEEIRTIVDGGIARTVIRRALANGIAADLAAGYRADHRELAGQVAALEMEIEALEAVAPTLGRVQAETTVAITPAPRALLPVAAAIAS
jgi:hypothetical protein